MKKTGKLEIKPLVFSAFIALSLFILLIGAGSEAETAQRAALNLSRAVQFKTISFQNSNEVDEKEFNAFNDFLEKTYPLIHRNLKKETVNDLGLLYTWNGSDPSLKPIVFLAHIDVVPIAPGTDIDWTYPPFEGRIADGFVWGRGTMDCKGFLMALMETVEALLSQGYRPTRTVYLCFGRDEEVGGKGAQKIAAILKERGVSAEYIIDEGGLIVDGKLVGIDKELAMVGVAEKGYLTLEMKVKTKGGHSSMPPRESAIGILSAAVQKLEKNPFPAKLTGVSEMTLDKLGPEFPSYMKFAIKNRGIFEGLIKNMLSKNNVSDAMIRTTTAVTIISAGTKENVLPQEATAIVNFRLLPGDSVDYVISRVKQVISDPRVSVEALGEPKEATKISNINSKGFGILERTIKEVFPEVVISPFLVLGGTDARNYEQVSDSIFRFSPLRATQEDQERPHGTDERVSVENYLEIINFYTSMIRNSQ